jgi:hypothetical protein
MIKLILLCVGLMTLLVLFPSACSSGTVNEPAAFLNQDFRLPVGGKIAITGEGINLKFEAVTSDSRCPQGVTCIWAGEAKCQLSVTMNKTVEPLVLTVSGSSLSQTVFKGYTFNFNLEPYPKAQQTIDKNSYVLNMKITR